LVVLAAISDSFGEVFYLKSLAFNDLTSRMKAEGGSIFLKQVLTYFLLKKDFGLLSFSISFFM